MFYFYRQTKREGERDGGGIKKERENWLPTTG